MPLSADQSRLILYWISGSPLLRQREEERFFSIIGSVDQEDLVDFVESAHLSGLLWSALKSPSRASACADLLARLAPEIEVRSVLNGCIAAELDFLDSAIARSIPDFRPVLLKGPAYWGTYYDTPIERRARDIDILMPPDAPVDAFCNMLESETYEGLHFVDDDRSVREVLVQGDVYSAPPYRIRRWLDEDVEFSPGAHAYLAEKGTSLGLYRADDGRFIIELDVELHSAFFVSDSGAIIGAEDCNFQRTGWLDQFQMLDAAEAVAYSGAKFYLEVVDALGSEQPSFKSLKLLADFVRIALSLSENDWDQGVQISRRWGCFHLLIDTLCSAMILAPELELIKTEPRGVDCSLEVLMRHGLSNAAPTLDRGVAAQC